MLAATVLIPTLNEEENIDTLLHRFSALRETCPYPFKILFIDSTSTDGTCEKVAGWKKSGWVELMPLHFDAGLAGAVLLGARQCSTKCVLVMDGDLSHPPEQVPELLGPVVSGDMDMMIGSRYIKGGSMPGWPLSRRLTSRLATLPAQCFCSVRDPLAGFFAVKRELLVGLPSEVPGFKIGLATLAHYGSSLRVGEIPIAFRDRHRGHSKMNRRVAMDYLRQLLLISKERLRL